MSMTTFRETVRPWLRTATASSVVRAPLFGMARAGVLPARVWKRLPVDRTFRVGVDDDGAEFYYLAEPDDVIGRRLYWRGLESWEPETTRVFARLARRAGLILDVGAKTGVFSLIACAANPRARVIAFEPAPSTHRCLSDHVFLNGWTDRCELRREAIADAPGMAEFDVPAEPRPASTGRHARTLRGLVGERIVVPVTTIDAVCPVDLLVDLVKINVGKSEDKVLIGMRRTFAASAPNLIVRCNPDGPHDAVEAILRPLGYRFYHLRDGGPFPVDGIVPDPRGRARNFLCTARGVDLEALRT